ncbi:GNAT family N-acetyltransferase [Paenibacillus macquariensis]|uniref:Acetyltransferase (GNAT) family protein n=1 Tax=Paenibacillus macquariensis TaxID=948756 RepID=A0ABY1KBH3_9BACL|nr:GNAT family N-acetyltransferase [Paenibacillus macquariensis]MEC0094275.1 GNAT family N-acetyltransferase [Paenibacillus macquariensis]OAB32166.1 acetyltransferase [Paenibacillus macquariensis subsp. macquariensis]SIR55544.1 Acetyltransferase (GNAT) family protein [Paenibacillus macquariensis]
MTITEVTTYPMDLLLLADPEEQAIQAYITRSKCYVKELDGKIVGTYVILPTRPHTIEIMNIAVEESLQGKGIGQQLIQHAIHTSKELGYTSIEIGTGNSSIPQLYLYQKCGFRIVGIDKDYFIQHYDEPIFENGLQCRDMVRLRQFI